VVVVATRRGEDEGGSVRQFMFPNASFGAAEEVSTVMISMMKILILSFIFTG
jgi:hypothetical protein